MSIETFDLVVIGGGPGGYVASIKAAQLGLKTACIEKRERLGGTCLNVGCIPSKALLHSSHKYEDATKHFRDHGIDVGEISVDLKKMMDRKEKVVSDLGKGIDGLLAKNKVTRLFGTGQFIDKNTVAITDQDGNTKSISAKNIIIATGSDVSSLSNINIDEKQIVSSTGALGLCKIPKHLVVIGAGVIGLEMAAIWRRLGSKVTVIEYCDKILPPLDLDISKEALKIFKKQGVEFQLSSRVVECNYDGKNIDTKVESLKDKSIDIISSDIVLVAVGRKAYTTGLGLENIGITPDKYGRIMVDGNLETSAKGVYAIGDVIEGQMLAHKAEEDGVFVVERLAGGAPHIDHNTIPSVVYTHPEIAAVGKTEEQLKESGVEYRVGKFPFLANSRARANGETDGFVKILTCAKTDHILGAHIIGSNAGDLIAEIVLGMEFKAAAEDIARTCHSHPGLGEAIKEASLSAYSKAIHI